MRSCVGCSCSSGSGRKPSTASSPLSFLESMSQWIVRWVCLRQVDRIDTIPADGVSWKHRSASAGNDKRPVLAPNSLCPFSQAVLHGNFSKRTLL